jgi:hypothetical protein
MSAACRLVLAGATWCVVACVGACGSVETPAEKQPLTPLPGRPPARVTTPAPPAEAGPDVAGFADDVAGAWRRNPGPVAVLPAFTDDPQHAPGTQVFATAAGDWLAARVLAALADAQRGVEAWPPETVAAELLRSNRSLCDVRLTQDVVPLLARTAAGYVVFGNVEKQSAGGRLSGQSRVLARLLCADLGSGEVISSREYTLTDATAVRELSARLERASSLPVGARAPRFTPSLDAEVALTAERALDQLLAAHRALLAGKRCTVHVRAAGGHAADALATTVRSTLVTRLSRALPGKDAVRVVERDADDDAALHASFDRGIERYALVLALTPRGAPAVQVSVPIDARFRSELSRVMP